MVFSSSMVCRNSVVTFWMQQNTRERQLLGGLSEKRTFIQVQLFSVLSAHKLRSCVPKVLVPVGLGPRLLNVLDGFDLGLA